MWAVLNYLEFNLKLIPKCGHVMPCPYKHTTKLFMMNSKPTQPFGRYGEQLAVKHLQAAGYEVITTNWRCPLGEIDIVAQKDNILVFVEVRSRHADNTEASFESINTRKQTKLAALANAYIDAHKLDEMVWRIDVIGVAIPHAGKAIIEHIEDALGW
jgi:putative endonuclease